VGEGPPKPPLGDHFPAGSGRQKQELSKNTQNQNTHKNAKPKNQNNFYMPQPALDFQQKFANVHGPNFMQSRERLLEVSGAAAGHRRICNLAHIANYFQIISGIN
jgi:hypothetical protein